MERLAARTEALAFRYFFADTLVACDMCLLREGTLIGLKTTYDESVPRRTTSIGRREITRAAAVTAGQFPLRTRSIQRRQA
jgi:hypothetical protein